MSVSSIFSQAAGSTNSVSALLQQLESPPAAGAAATPTTAGDSTGMSQMGQLMSQLQQLATTNPSEFKQVTAGISSQLTQAAKQQSGSSSSSMTIMAAKFLQASQTGNMAPLESHGHGHGHGGGGGGVSALLNAASATTQAATSAYSSQSTSPLSSLESIIQSALSGATSSTAPSTS